MSMKVTINGETYPIPRGGPLTEAEREMRIRALQRHLDERWERLRKIRGAA